MFIYLYNSITVQTYLSRCVDKRGKAPSDSDCFGVVHCPCARLRIAWTEYTVTKKIHYNTAIDRIYHHQSLISDRFDSLVPFSISFINRYISATILP